MTAVIRTGTVRIEHGVPPYIEGDWEEWEQKLQGLDENEGMRRVMERAKSWLVKEFGKEVEQENVPDEVVLELYLES